MSVCSLYPDEQILVLLCTNLTMKPGDDNSCSVNPLSPKEWHALDDNLRKMGITPSALAEMSMDDLKESVNLNEPFIERITNLLKRGGQLALEIEHLAQIGIWIITELDEAYPENFLKKLKGRRPPVIFGAGDKLLLSDGGLAIIGSRNVDTHGALFAEQIAQLCAEEGINVISGAARGVDEIAITSALRNRGKSVGILADSLEKFISNREYRELIWDDYLSVITQCHPRTNFSVPNAMSRNKLIYALADYALVVSSDKEKGGTWAGATEALNNNYSLVFVRDGENVPDGNKSLLKKGAIPFPQDFDGGVKSFLNKHIMNKTENDPSDKRDNKQLKLDFKPGT